MSKVSRVKKKDHEKLSDANIKHVIELLEADKPITKKTACEILNISYNTTRLKNIIDGYQSRKATEKKHRDRNRGKPATEDEISEVISEYLTGTNVTDIAKNIYRSSSFVKGIINRLGIPEKLTGDDKYSTAILPDQCVSETFTPGQVVWSAKYHTPCEIISEVDGEQYEQKYGCKAYRIYVIEALDEAPEYFPRVTVGGFNAVALACDLGNLEHLEHYDFKYTH